MHKKNARVSFEISEKIQYKFYILLENLDGFSIQSNPIVR